MLTEQHVRDLGYVAARQLPSGEWLGVRPQIYTWSLCRAIDESGHGTRYCYEHLLDALTDLLDWDGADDPRGAWIKKKGRGVDALNPTLARDDFGEAARR